MKSQWVKEHKIIATLGGIVCFFILVYFVLYSVRLLVPQDRFLDYMSQKSIHDKANN